MAEWIDGDAWQAVEALMQEVSGRAAVLTHGAQQQADTSMTAVEAEMGYDSSLIQLEAMGFTDPARNLEMIRMCEGNVELALDLLMSN